MYELHSPQPWRHERWFFRDDRVYCQPWRSCSTDLNKVYMRSVIVYKVRRWKGDDGCLTTLQCWYQIRSQTWLMTLCCVRLIFHCSCCLGGVKWSSLLCNICTGKFLNILNVPSLMTQLKCKVLREVKEKGEETEEVCKINNEQLLPVCAEGQWTAWDHFILRDKAGSVLQQQCSHRQHTIYCNHRNIALFLPTASTFILWDWATCCTPFPGFPGEKNTVLGHFFGIWWLNQ